ncbi:MAG TPA: universal stress protein [Burkholderiaceae bacterium]|nr:universal stress protein [Burkholderiaceae bacterium]
MFDRILVPVDGSSEARAAAHQALQLAQALHATVVALHVAPPFQTRYFEDFVPPPDATRELWQAGLRNVAERYFRPIKDEAQDLGVELDTDVVFDERPGDAIGTAALEHDCSLIVIGPRGRGGVARYLLGSVTTRVLGATSVPVLVHRSGPAG